MIPACFAESMTVRLCNAESTTLALAMPVKSFTHAELMSWRPEGLVAVHVCRCISSQRPLSYQSWPRVGTTISSVLISLKT